MKKLALIIAGALVGLIALVVVAVVAAPPLINWNHFKPQIEIGRASCRERV